MSEEDFAAAGVSTTRTFYRDFSAKTDLLAFYPRKPPLGARQTALVSPVTELILKASGHPRRGLQRAQSVAHPELLVSQPQGSRAELADRWSGGREGMEW